jgi:hypothetical protein
MYTKIESLKNKHPNEVDKKRSISFHQNLVNQNIWFSGPPKENSIDRSIDE